MLERLLPALCCAGLLAACDPAMTRPDESAPPASSRGSCDAAKAQSFNGQVASDEVQEQARRAAGAGMVRTLQPGQPVSKEFNGERLNLHVDDSNKVIRVSCG